MPEYPESEGETDPGMAFMEANLMMTDTERTIHHYWKIFQKALKKLRKAVKSGDYPHVSHASDIAIEIRAGRCGYSRPLDPLSHRRACHPVCHLKTK